MSYLIDPKLTIDANPLNLNQLLGPYKFIILNYQRGYVWKKPQVKQMWNDIKDLYKRSTERERSAALSKQRRQG